MVDESNFTWSESPVPSPKDGEILVKTLWLSFDPTQRGWMSRDTYMPKIPLGEVMKAFAVGEVVESRNPVFKTGDLVTGLFGWEDYFVTDARSGGLSAIQKVPQGVQPDLALSLLGITGLTAYFGAIEVGQCKVGETFVVSAAAGAVGSVAGQIAKIKGCRVIGIAGGKAKCDWIVKEAGFDGAIDYKSEDVGSRLSELCPKGIDVYFDNVGGPILDEALARINMFARIVICGAISQYNSKVPYGPKNYVSLMRRSRMEGFLVFQFHSQFAEATQALTTWHREGRLKQKEDIAFGLENAPRTLIRLFTGENFGKQLLKIADPS